VLGLPDEAGRVVRLAVERDVPLGSRVFQVGVTRRVRRATVRARGG